MKKRWTVAVALMLVALMLCACGRQESPVEDFKYEMVDGEVIITGYTGTDREIYIPAMINERPVTQIGEEAFAGYDLTLVDIPDSITVIGEYAFVSCDCLEDVRLPDSELRIEAYAFYECDVLAEIELPDNLQFLGYGAFSYCNNLEKLKLPEKFEGFEIEYRQRIVWNDDKYTDYSIIYRYEINNPVNSETTTLVVQKDSKAESLLKEYGCGEIDYIVE